MHSTAGRREWFAAAAAKFLFQSILDAARLCAPALLVITQAGRDLATAPTIIDPTVLAELLRQPGCYPLFAKPAQAKYSLRVVSADSYDDHTDEVELIGGAWRAAAKLLSGQSVAILLY